MNYQELGLFIKQERKKLHLTQKELADLAEVSYRMLQHVEAGRQASEKLLGQVVKKLGYDIDIQVEINIEVTKLRK